MALPSQAPNVARIGDYEILCQLAAGAMGTVYKAYDAKLERTVALKFLSAGVVSPAEHDTILREARAASALDHKNIGSIHSVEKTSDGHTFIVMGYYEGESLAARIRREPLSIAETLDAVRQIAAGLSHAHSHGIIHRDIKPSNVMLTTDGEVKIVDFGLARCVGTDVPTQTLSFAGTLPYMSPEQLCSRPVDARTDIWSLGVLLFELLSRHLPFQGDSTAAAVEAILHKEPSRLSELPAEFQEIIRRALAKNPEKRYRSCYELVHDLNALEVASTAPTPGDAGYKEGDGLPFLRRLGVPAKCHKRAWLTFAVLAVIAVLSVVAGRKLFRSWSPDAQPSEVPQVQRRIGTTASDLYLSGMKTLERYDKRENLAAAIALFERSAAADPNFALAYAGLCEAYYDKFRIEQDPKRLDEASGYCSKAGELNSKLPAVHVALGRVHNELGQHNVALQDYQRALALDPTSATALLGIGEVYQNLGRIEEAEASITKGVTLRPDSWDGYHRLAYFYFRQRRYKEAAEQYRNELKYVPDSPGAHANLGVMLLYLEQYSAAESELKQSLRIAPSYNAYSSLGSVYYRQRRFADCVEMNKKALEISSADYRVWGNLALAYQWLGQNDKAREAYGQKLQRVEKLARLRPQDGDLQAELGVMYAKLSNREKALPRLQAAAALASDDGGVLLSIADGYAVLGDQEKALHFVRESVRRGSTASDLREDPDLRALLDDPALRKEFGFNDGR